MNPISQRRDRRTQCYWHGLSKISLEERNMERRRNERPSKTEVEGDRKGKESKREKDGEGDK